MIATYGCRVALAAVCKKGVVMVEVEVQQTEVLNDLHIYNDVRHVLTHHHVFR